MKIVLTPDWFLGSDVVIDGISFFVLLAFFLLSYRSYKVSKNKNSLYLGVGFLLIAFAELATIVTKMVLYYDFFFTQNIGELVVTYKVAKSVDIFYYIGFFWHKFLTLVGLYIIYRISLRGKSNSDFFLALCFFVISAIFSNAFYYLFHMAALILLLLIISSYYEVYKKNRSNNTKMLLIAFGMQALSQVIFVMSKLQILYAIAQVIQLVSYLILLVLVIKIIYFRKSNKK